LVLGMVCPGDCEPLRSSNAFFGSFSADLFLFLAPMVSQDARQ